MNTVSFEQIELMTGPQLIALYNEFAPKAGKSTVKRFADRITGMRRTSDVFYRIAKIEHLVVQKRIDEENAKAEAERAAVEKAATKPGLPNNSVTALMSELRGKKVAKQTKMTSAPKPAKAARAPSFASRCRELFAQGLDNAAVWAIVQPEFGKSDDKKWHVAWHRADIARKAVK